MVALKYVQNIPTDNKNSRVPRGNGGVVGFKHRHQQHICTSLNLYKGSLSRFVQVLGLIKHNRRASFFALHHSLCLFFGAAYATSPS